LVVGHSPRMEKASAVSCMGKQLKEKI